MPTGEETSLAMALLVGDTLLTCVPPGALSYCVSAPLADFAAGLALDHVFKGRDLNITGKSLTFFSLQYVLAHPILQYFTALWPASGRAFSTLISEQQLPAAEGLLSIQVEDGGGILELFLLATQYISFILTLYLSSAYMSSNHRASCHMCHF